MFTRFSFYRSDVWHDLVERLRLERVGADGLLRCAYCGEPILKPYDCIGHHKVELTDENVNDYSISLNADNVDLIHFSCHNKSHKRFEGFSRSVYLVYGAPCSGKSSWVDDVAEADDLILDIDRIWTCFCNSDKYHKPNKLKANVYGVFNTVIDQIRTRTGMWTNAYIVGGFPLRTDRDRLCELLGARTVFIESDMDTCLNRCTSDVWREYVREWFGAHTE